MHIGQLPFFVCYVTFCMSLVDNPENCMKISATIPPLSRGFYGICKTRHTMRFSSDPMRHPAHAGFFAKLFRVDPASDRAPRHVPGLSLRPLRLLPRACRMALRLLLDWLEGAVAPPRVPDGSHALRSCHNDASRPPCVPDGCHERAIVRPDLTLLPRTCRMAVLPLIESTNRLAATPQRPLDGSRQACEDRRQQRDGRADRLPTRAAHPRPQARPGSA